MASAKRTMDVHVAPKAFFKILTNFERYPKFLSALTGARVLRREKGEKKSVVEFEAKVVRPFRYTLELQEEPDEKLTWTLLDGDFMRRNDGRWLLEAVGKNKTRATYEIDVTLSPLVPNFVTKLLVNETLVETMDQFRKEAEASGRTGSKKRAL